MQTTQTHQEMECPICYDEINAQTGIVTTSCGHSYHFSCISHWYAKQEVGSCPCCRKEAGEKEKLPEIQYEDEENSDDEEEEEFEEVEFTRAELHAFLQARGGSLSDALALAVCEVVCGLTFTELNFLMLGNCGRALTQDEWNELLQAQDEDEEETDDDESQDEDLQHNGPLSLLAAVSEEYSNGTDFNQGAQQDAEDDRWISFNGQTLSVTVSDEFSHNNVPIVWRYIPFSDDDMRSMSRYMPEVFARLDAVVKIQSSWRGYKVRQRINRI